MYATKEYGDLWCSRNSRSPSHAYVPRVCRLGRESPQIPLVDRVVTYHESPKDPESWRLRFWPFQGPFIPNDQWDDHCHCSLKCLSSINYWLLDLRNGAHLLFMYSFTLLLGSKIPPLGEDLEIEKQET